MSYWIALLLVFQVPAREAEPGTGPAPAPVPIAWEFEFKALDPRRIEVALPGQPAPEEFWYVVYTVVNTSETTQRFFPTFQIVTEDLNVIDTDLGISPLVFEAIRQRHRLTHKFLVSPTEAIGDLKSGEDHARESVAIWRNVDLKGNRFSIFVAGLSGETRLVPNPSHDPTLPETRIVRKDGFEQEVTVNPRMFTLRKTREIAYQLPGSRQPGTPSEPRRAYERWIMR